MREWGGDNHLGHLQSSCISKLKMGEIAQTQSGRLISFSGEVGEEKKKKVEGNETRPEQESQGSRVYLMKSYQWRCFVLVVLRQSKEISHGTPRCCE